MITAFKNALKRILDACYLQVISPHPPASRAHGMSIYVFANLSTLWVVSFVLLLSSSSRALYRLLLGFPMLPLGHRLLVLLLIVVAFITINVIIRI
jgi:hypothetical protein